MPAYPYDLHIHSCLSPCGEAENTPANLANLAALLGLSLVALTDHNSCKNAKAFLAAAKRAEREQGVSLLALAGMELTTAEEIHVVCLFPDGDAAMAFDQQVEKALPAVANRPEIFGAQTMMDENDRITGTFDPLLIPATTISINRVPALVSRLGGVCFPAHIERGSYSVLSSLGAFPTDCGFTAFEMADKDKLPALLAQNPCLSALLLLTSSDAHRLEVLGCRGAKLNLPELTEAALFAAIRGADEFRK